MCRFEGVVGSLVLVCGLLGSLVEVELGLFGIAGVLEAGLVGFGGSRVARCDLVVMARQSMVNSLSLMNLCHICCSSSCSVESVVLGRSSRVGDMNPGILGSQDKGSTLE